MFLAALDPHRAFAARKGIKARQWAAEGPNLLSVAVSRAKRRLFVIGNRDRWCRESYFAQLADTDLLPVRTWPPTQTTAAPPPPS